MAEPMGEAFSIGNPSSTEHEDVMRGSFDDSLSVRYGPLSDDGPPGVVWVSGVQCRKVEQTEIHQHQFPFDLTSHWVTLDAVDLHGPLISTPWVGAVFTEYRAADEVQFDSAPGDWFTVCRSEFVAPPGRVPYWRYLLLSSEVFASPPWPPLSPPPPPPPPPGPALTPPAHNCGVPTVVTELGTYRFGSWDGYFTGWYQLLITISGPIKFRLVDPVNPDVQLVVAATNVGDSCCGEKPWFVLSADGSHCQTFNYSRPGTPNRQYCFYVQSTTGEGPSSLVVAIEAGAC